MAFWLHKEVEQLELVLPAINGYFDDLSPLHEECNTVTLLMMRSL